MPSQPIFCDRCGKNLADTDGFTSAGLCLDCVKEKQEEAFKRQAQPRPYINMPDGQNLWPNLWNK